MSKKNDAIQIRVTEKEKNRIKMLADKFANGNMSQWIIYGALHVSRKNLPSPKKS